MTKEVKKIIHSAMDYDCVLSNCLGNETCEECAIRRICQLIEPKPDEGVLIDTTILPLPSYILNELDITEELKAQRDLTASIKDAECQARVERIFGEIEDEMFLIHSDDVPAPATLRLSSKGDSFNKWQALKKKEGVAK